MKNQRNTGYNFPTNTTVTTTTENHHNRSTGNTGGTSSPGARARACAYAREAEAEAEAARAAMLHGQYVDCCEYYVASFRRHLPAVIQREIATRIRDGMSADVLRAAMDETQQAPRPSWSYCAAILRRCDMEGIKTLEQWRASKERYNNSRNPALAYDQRQYAEDDFGEDFFFDLKAYAKGANNR